MATPRIEKMKEALRKRGEALVKLSVHPFAF
jgi:hypothetical protein